MESARDRTGGYVFTLVHGTFAEDAEWTQEDSPLCKALREDLGDRVHFQCVKWGP